jgi:ribulose-5-phosphate 4-epimerase/fuculose-1-phosphate aldolase
VTTIEAIPRAALPVAGSLSAAAEVAVLARALHRVGYDDHLAGHITYNLGDGTLLANPFELFWDELRASDIVRVDLDGNIVEGRHSVTPAIQLHLAIHRRREDVRVAVHHHPLYATVWAGLCRRCRPPTTRSPR